TVDEICPAVGDCGPDRLIAKEREYRLACRDNADDGHGSPERREAWRELVDGQAPEQDHQRNDEVETCAYDIPCARQRDDGCSRVVQREIFIARGEPDAHYIDRDRRKSEDGGGRASKGRLNTLNAIVQQAKHRDGARKAEEIG